MIRAHNEVMQVIGVAEPDTDPSTSEFNSLRRYVAFEENMGQRLLKLGRILEVGGLWGVNGLRARILIYKRYADISFFDLFKHERSQGSTWNLLLDGLPMFLAGHVFKAITRPKTRKRGLRRRWLDPVFAYIRLHLQLYVIMQRLDILPPGQWLPDWTYFIIGSPSSPVPAPPPPQDLSATSLLRYAGAWCLNATPFIAFVVWNRVWRRTTATIWQALYARLPNTVHNRRMLPSIPPELLAAATTAMTTTPAATAASATAGTQPEPQEAPSRQPVDLPPQTRPEVLRGIDEQQVTETSSNGPRPGPDTPAAAEAPAPARPSSPRRPSVFSNRAEDYSSDEEEEGGISATLISFDVEATESSDAPPGLWSAELRPSAGPDGSGQGTMPMYVDTMLTRLPACLATDVFTVISSYVLLAPYEAVALRLVARMYRQRMGLPVFDIFGPNMFDGLSWRLVTNFIGVEFIHLVVAGEMWALVSMIGQVLHMTEDEWKEMEASHAAERARQREQIERHEQIEEHEHFEQQRAEQQQMDMQVQVELQDRLERQEQMEIQQMQEEVEMRERIHREEEVELRRQIEELERELGHTTEQSHGGAQNDGVQLSSQ